MIKVLSAILASIFAAVAFVAFPGSIHITDHRHVENAGVVGPAPVIAPAETAANTQSSTSPNRDGNAGSPEAAHFPVRPTTSTDGWRTYTNKEYGFKVRYPADLLFVADPAQLTSFGDSETELVAIKMDGTNKAAHGEWTLSASSYPDNVAHCLDIPNNNDYPGVITYSDAGTTTINLIPFSSHLYWVNEVANFGYGKSYKTIRSYTCFIVAVDVRGNHADMDTSQLALAKADGDQIMARLDPIVQTLRF